MVRIAGIDRELSTLELLWAQSDDQEKMMLATQFLTDISVAMYFKFNCNQPPLKGE
jgi:hypothetical protein